MPKTKPFPTEVDLCSAFIAAVPPTWTAYAETAGYDIVLVRGDDGFQIGIEAKLRLTPVVVAQLLEREYNPTDALPDCRAVLVPHDEVSAGLPQICHNLGITIITVRAPEQMQRWPNGRERFDPELPNPKQSWSERFWFELAPDHRLGLPQYVPDVVAGARSPLQLTDWKINALRITVLLDLRGQVTRRDFAQFRIDYRRWIAPVPGWLVKNAEGAFIKGPGYPDFAKQHPVVYEKIKADAPAWMRPPVDSSDQPKLV